MGTFQNNWTAYFLSIGAGATLALERIVFVLPKFWLALAAVFAFHSPSLGLVERCARAPLTKEFSIGILVPHQTLEAGVVSFHLVGKFCIHSFVLLLVLLIGNTSRAAIGSMVDRKLTCVCRIRNQQEGRTCVCRIRNQQDHGVPSNHQRTN